MRNNWLRDLCGGVGRPDGGNPVHCYQRSRSWDQIVKAGISIEEWNREMLKFYHLWKRSADEILDALLLAYYRKIVLKKNPRLSSVENNSFDSCNWHITGRLSMLVLRYRKARYFAKSFNFDKVMVLAQRSWLIFVRILLRKTDCCECMYDDVVEAMPP